MQKSDFQSEFATMNLALNEQQCRDLLARALAHGGVFSEAYFEDSESIRVQWEHGKLEKIVERRDKGCGIRVLLPNSVAYSYTTDLSIEGLLRCADSVALSVHLQSGGGIETKGKNRSSGPVVAKEFLAQTQPSAELNQFRPERSAMEYLSIRDRVSIVSGMESAARRELPNAIQVSCSLLNTRKRHLIVTSEGKLANDQKEILTYTALVVGQENGRIESSYEVESTQKGIEHFAESSPDSIAQLAAQRAKQLLSARPAPAGTLTVVVASEAGGTLIHEAVGHGLEADLACEGFSIFQNRVGQQVASPLVTVIDDGGIPGFRGSYRFDDEGEPSKKTTLIENGILKGYMVDRAMSQKYELASTGNGRRESFRHIPMVRMTNTYIARGKDDAATILQDTPRGLYVKSMGGGQVDTLTGDFVFAVTEGYLIRDGKIAEPVRGATLVGNGPQVLMGIDRIANDLVFGGGTCGKNGQGVPVTDAVPTLRIAAITVGGEEPSELVFGNSIH